MNQAQGDAPLACGLSHAELRERQATLLAHFNSAVIATQELADGYAFQISSDKTSMVTAAELIAAERECCPFLTFELIVQSNGGPVTLRVTGPPGAKEFWMTMLSKA